VLGWVITFATGQVVGWIVLVPVLTMLLWLGVLP
jgi:hypothetical protein